MYETEWAHKLSVAARSQSRTRPPLRASLVLHIILRNNALFSVVFAAAMWLNYAVKIERDDLGTTKRSWYASIILIWMLFEPLRLMSGYVGNKQQNVSYIFGCLLLTFTVTNALMIVFIIVIPGKDAVDRAFSIVMLLHGWATILAGVRLLRRLIAANTVRFYVNLAYGDAFTGDSEEGTELMDVCGNN
eukprot:PhM_4_TR2494/c0_g1_i1/m.89732/K19384/TMEM17; transmembrane protein 17